jgi:hypothetical protein
MSRKFRGFLWRKLGVERRKRKKVVVQYHESPYFFVNWQKCKNV